MSTNNIQSYSPAELITIFGNVLSRQNEFAQLVYLKGIYQKKPHNPNWSYCYDVLRDEVSQDEITIRLTKDQQDSLSNGNLVLVGGLLDRKITNKGSIQLTLNVTRVEKLQEQVVSEDDQRRIEIRKAKSQIGYKNVDSTLETILMGSRKPKVALVFANGSITMTDFESGINSARAFIDFYESRVNFANPREFCSHLQTINTTDCDVICVVRGGGSGIDNLDNLDILSTIANLNKPTISAVGHPEEKLFFKSIVDKEISTPTGLGQYFSEMCERVNAQKTHSKAVLVNEVRKQFQDQIETQNKTISALQKQVSDQVKLVSDSKVEVERMKNVLKNNKQIADQKRKGLIKTIVWLSIALAAVVCIVIKLLWLQ